MIDSETTIHQIIKDEHVLHAYNVWIKNNLVPDRYLCLYLEEKENIV